MSGHDVNIIQENERVAKVVIDGKELKGVQYVNYRIGIDEIPIITVEFIPGTLNFEKEKENLKLNVTIDGELIAKKVIEEINKRMSIQGEKGVNV